jgi:hypothetical protein
MNTPRRARRLAIGIAVAGGLGFALSIGLMRSLSAREDALSGVHCDGGHARQAQLIEHETARARDGSVTESWADRSRGKTRTLDYARDGKLIDESVSTEHGYSWLVEDVDFVSHTFSRHRQELSFLAPSAVSSLNEEASSIRDRIASGTTVVVGREEIAGRSALHIRWSSGGVVSSLVDLWVDNATCLPVLAWVTSSGGRTETSDEWLPRTSRNLAKTRLVVPRGFKRSGEPAQVSVPRVHPDNVPVVTSGTVTLKSP